jgi:hypothetical protein
MDDHHDHEMESLEEQIRQKESTIAELEKLNAEKDDRIRELLSQLDKYKSVLQFSTAATGVHGAGKLGGGRRLRAWGISAEPQSSHSVRGQAEQQMPQSCQKFYKDQR